jgi:Transposase DDE domain group 1
LVVSHLDEFEPGLRYHAYGQRGQGANLLKECNNARTGERLSCPRLVAHCWRLREHAGADRLMRALRSAAQALHSELGWPQCDTMRRRLLKVAALVRQSVRRIVVQLPRALPCAARGRALALCTSGAGVT